MYIFKHVYTSTCTTFVSMTLRLVLFHFKKKIKQQEDTKRRNPSQGKRKNYN